MSCPNCGGSKPVGGLGARPYRQLFGAYLGYITHVRKSDGWCTIRVPQILGYQDTDWARPMGESLSGVLPGQPAIVHFLGGDINQPAFSLTTNPVIGGDGGVTSGGGAGVDVSGIASDAAEALTVADAASTVANSAKSTANSAQSTANNAQSTANSAQSTANNALPKNNPNWTGEANGDFQGTINGHSLSGSQVLYLQSLGRMGTVNPASPTNTNQGFNSGGFSNLNDQVNSVCNQLNSLLNELQNQNYMF